MAEWGAIAEQDVELLRYADTPAEAFEQLRDHLIAHHLEPASRAGSGGARHREDAGLSEPENHEHEGHVGHGAAGKTGLYGRTRRKGSRHSTRTVTGSVGRSAGGRDRGGARRAPGAGQVDGARDRPPPGRQRDDVGVSSAPAARADHPASPATTRTSSRAGCTTTGPIEASLDAFGAARRIDGRNSRADERGEWARKARTARAAADSVERWLKLRRRTPTITPPRSGRARTPAKNNKAQAKKERDRRWRARLTSGNAEIAETAEHTM